MRGLRGKSSRFRASVPTVENEVKDQVSLRRVQSFMVVLSRCNIVVRRWQPLQSES